MFSKKTHYLLKETGNYHTEVEITPYQKRAKIFTDYETVRAAASRLGNIGFMVEIKKVGKEYYYDGS